MVSRTLAIARAEARFPAVAEHLLATHQLLLPRHALYVAAFFFGLSDEERGAAWSIDAGGLFGIGEWFEDGALDKRAYADPRVHGRYRRDPPEMVTFVSGNSDGSHWGLWYDDPNELPRVTVHNWARDSAETDGREPTLLAAIHTRAMGQERRRDAAARSTLAWLEELLPLERAAHDAEHIADPPPRTHLCIGGMDPFVGTLPPDLFYEPKESARGDAYRANAPEVGEWIARARAELANGEPIRALFLGRELHWFDRDAQREACTELLVGAYRALGRGALADIVVAHHAGRDAPSVSAYTVSSAPFALAAVRGDAAEVAKLIGDPTLTHEQLSDAAVRARSAEVRELLLSRSPALLDDALRGAISRASPRYYPHHREAARVLRDASARGETREELLAELLRSKRYAVWRVVRDEGDTLDPEAREADLDQLLARRVATGGAMDPLVPELVAAGLADRALPLVPTLDLAWRTREGTSLLHIGARHGAIALVEALLARGADRTVRDQANRTARDCARDLWREDAEAGSSMLVLLREPGEPAPPPAPTGTGPIAAGEKVVHAKFGAGTVVAAKDGKLTIRFADAERTLVERFVTRA